MTVGEIRVDRDNYDKFPVGLRVLAVDDDRVCLNLLETLLRKCQYHVTATSQAIVALNMLREDKDRFDLVISDVHMPDMDGFKLLELVGLEMDLPVIMLSANSDPKLVMKGVTHGACDYLVKPVRIEELKNIWQHVLRRKKFDSKNRNNKSNDQVKASGENHESSNLGNGEQNVKFSRKREDEDYESDENGNESDDLSTQKKPRVVWTSDLHRKFVQAVYQLGFEKAVPKKILDTMNVEGLTRENVASHLQKFRLYLKRISLDANQRSNMAVGLGAKDYHFMRMNSLDGLGGDFRSLTGQGRRFNNSPLSSSPYTFGRFNSSANNLNLYNPNPPSLIQPTHGQNLINPLGKNYPVFSPSSQNPFQGILPSLDSFTDSNSLNGSTNSPMMLHGNSRNPLVSGFGNPFGNNNIGPFNSDSSYTDSSNFLDPNANQSTKMQSTSLLSEPFMPQLNRTNSSNASYLQSNPLQERLVGSNNNTFGSLTSCVLNNSGAVSSSLNRILDQNNGIVNGKTVLQASVDEKPATESRMRSHENELIEKSPGGFVPQSFDPIEAFMNSIIKPDDDGTFPNCDFGLEDLCF